jgi:type II secretory pathway predicted ATPase ExeA
VGKLSRLETFVNIGFADDPFRSFSIETADSIRVRRILEMAVKARAVVSIVGDRGIGKSRSVMGALRQMGVKVITVRSADRARILITDIEQAMVIDLSDETPRRGREIRARQLRRIIGQASRTQRVVLVIEEGHRMHGQTLRAIKNLRELDWMGETELFTVVLIGHSDPMSKPGLAEVRLRSDAVRMHGLTKKDVVRYVEGTVGEVFAPKAIEAVADLDGTRNFLDLQSVLVDLMGAAVTHGTRQVNLEHVWSVFGSGAKGGQQGKSERPISPAKSDAVLKMIAGQEEEPGGRKLQAV